MSSQVEVASAVNSTTLVTEFIAPANVLVIPLSIHWKKCLDPKEAAQKLEKAFNNRTSKNIYVCARQQYKI